MAGSGTPPRQPQRCWGPPKHPLGWYHGLRPPPKAQDTPQNEPPPPPKTTRVGPPSALRMRQAAGVHRACAGAPPPYSPRMRRALPPRKIPPGTRPRPRPGSRRRLPRCRFAPGRGRKGGLIPGLASGPGLTRPSLTSAPRRPRWRKRSGRPPAPLYIVGREVFPRPFLGAGQWEGASAEGAPTNG